MITKKITIEIPEQMLKKLALFTAELNVRSSQDLNRNDTILVGIAKLIQAEHLLAPYFDLKKKPVPVQVLPLIVHRKGHLDKVVDQALADARKRQKTLGN